MMEHHGTWERNYMRVCVCVCVCVCVTQSLDDEER